MASGSDVTFQIQGKHVPLLEGTKQFAEQQLFPGGSRANYEWLKNDIRFAEGLSEVERLILCDAVTSGGLFISLPESEALNYVNDLREKYAIDAKVIGKVVKKGDKAINVF